VEPLHELLARLERERAEADKRYNEALTALDRSLASGPELPGSPTPYDTQRLPHLNATWNLLPAGPPVVDRSLKGRLRGFVWRLIGPALERQTQFNSILVDHLNLNVPAHEGSAHAVAALIDAVRQAAEVRARVDSHLMQYLQTITGYADTKDRLIGAQAHVVNAGLAALSDDWMKRWESAAVRGQRQHDELDLVLEDVRATSALAQQTALSLKREVTRLLESASDVPAPERDAAAGAGPAVPLRPGPAARASLDSFKYLAFENEFRGPQEEIRQRLRDYVPVFAGSAGVLEVGCGRGEFLELLREHGVTARGIDTNQAMVDEARARGLDAECADAIEYLLSREDGSIGGLFAAQVVEHLSPEYLGRLLEVAVTKLRPNALLVLETINPSCWVAFFESYIRDLTHVRPLHPETLQYLVRVNGFQHVRIEYKAPVPREARLDSLTPSPDDAPGWAMLVETFNRNVQRLNDRMFTYQDYAVIGRR
jgi:O-antigen chain-terminating methyltransferase